MLKWRGIAASMPCSMGRRAQSIYASASSRQAGFSKDYRIWKLLLTAETQAVWRSRHEHNSGCADLAMLARWLMEGTEDLWSETATSPTPRQLSSRTRSL